MAQYPSAFWPDRSATGEAQKRGEPTDRPMGRDHAASGRASLADLKCWLAPRGRSLPLGSLCCLPGEFEAISLAPDRAQ
jgi:hypothetical protein